MITFYLKTTSQNIFQNSGWSSLGCSLDSNSLHVSRFENVTQTSATNM